MIISLLSTKLFIPRTRPHFVSRPRLMARLSKVIEQPLALIAAPAGFGKTTLLSEWVQSLVKTSLPHQSKEAPGIGVAWLSLDENDNDPTRFWAYFVGALENVDAHLGVDALAVLQSSQPPPPETVLTLLLNDIADFQGHLILILDDYHVVDTPAIHAGLAFVIDHLPPQLHLVITSRADPPLPVSRLRARGQLVELRADDLRFLPDEAAAFLNQVMGLDLSARDVAALETRTEGWIAGLQLAALSMEGHTDTAGFINAFAGGHHFILDYLADEVLQQRPRGTQNFLLQTSILDRLCSPLCDALTRQNDGQITLERLERANLFLIPLDEERRWYRYHHLFADMLRIRLKQTQPQFVSELHRRASEWFEQNGLAAEAIKHALAASDFERAAGLIEQNGKALLSRGEVGTLQPWLQALPDQVVRARPRLGLLRAWMLFLAGDWLALESYLQAAEAVLQTQGAVASPADLLAVQGEVAALRGAVAANRVDLPSTIELCQQALDLLPLDDSGTRSRVAMNLGDAYFFSGDMEASNQAYREAAAIGQAGGHIYTSLLAQYFMAYNHLLQGRLSEVVSMAQQAKRLALEHGGPRSPALALAYLALGLVLCQRNELAEAARYLTEAIALAEQSGHKEIIATSYGTPGLLALAQGEIAYGLETIQKSLHILPQIDVNQYLISEMLAWQARLWLAQGDLAAAARWARERQLRVDDDWAFVREPEYVALARILIAQNELDQALRLLARLQQRAESGGRFGAEIEVLALQALAYQARGDVAQAFGAVERALALAEPEGFVRTFVDEGEPMRKIMSHWRLRSAPWGLEIGKRGSLDEVNSRLMTYADKLLAAFPGASPQLPIINDQRPIPEGRYAVSHLKFLPESLSEREMEVLRLVAAGRSDRQIAEELIVTVGTVKRHLNNIYGKLGVHSRTQALARAGELGLL